MMHPCRVRLWDLASICVFSDVRFASKVDGAVVGVEPGKMDLSNLRPDDLWIVQVTRRALRLRLTGSLRRKSAIAVVRDGA